MTPYYQEQDIVIYHGSCYDLLPELATFDLLLTDPPYGIGFVHSGGGGSFSSKTMFGGVKIVGDDQPFDPRPFLHLAPKKILWGANHYASKLPDERGWISWDKRKMSAQNDQSDCELAWTQGIMNTARIFYHMWNGGIRDSENGPRKHPSMKPASLMTYCLGLAKLEKGSAVIDPFMGSGPIAEACKLLGLKYVGVEIELKYVEAAVKRLDQGVMAL